MTVQSLLFPHERGDVPAKFPAYFISYNGIITHVIKSDDKFGCIVNIFIAKETPEMKKKAYGQMEVGVESRFDQSLLDGSICL